MDIHRARFIPHPSPAINSLAFSASYDGELSKGGLKNLRLAVGRDNGDIQIWNPLRGAWACERTFHSGRDRSIEALLWTQEPNEYNGSTVSATGQLRLFSIGHSNTVTEWDLGTGLPIERETGGNLSTIWCFAAQPRLHPREAQKAAAAGKPQGQDLVVGCEDGSIALLSTADNDLQFSRYIARAQGKSVRALSIAFRDRDTVAVGLSNGTVKIYDIRNSTSLRTITLGAGKKNGPKNIYVWALKWLPNGDLVTGDSYGEFRVFDGKLFAQSQRIVAHKGDIFSIAVNKEGTKLFTAGADMKTSVFQKGKGRHWNKMSHRSYHEHDVKALAVYDGGKTQKLSFLASGGVDTNLSIVPVEAYGEEYHRVISGLPQTPQATSAPAARLLASWEAHTIAFWSIKPQQEITNKKLVHRLLARIEVKGDQSIAECALTRDGRHIAVTTSAKTKIFRIAIPDDGSLTKIKQVKLGTSLAGGSTVQISPDQKWLSIVTPSNKIHLHRLTYDDARLKVSPKFIALTRPKRRSADTSSLSSYRQAITRQVFSDDSKVLVVADLSGILDAWQLNGEEDLATQDEDMKDEEDESSDEDSDAEDNETPAKLNGQSWTLMESVTNLPLLDSSALIMSFRPGKASIKPQLNGDASTEEGTELSYTPNPNYELFVLTANHQLHEFDLTTGKLTDWSRRNPTAHLPEGFRKIKDRVMDCFWHTTTEAQRLYLHGSNWIFNVDVSRDLDVPVMEDGEAEDGVIERPNKRKWEGESGAGDRKRAEDYTGFKPGITVTGEIPPQKKAKIEPASKLVTNEDSDNEEFDEEDDEEDVHASTALAVQKEGAKEVNGEVNPKARKTWYSFAYRPILTVVPLEQREEYIEAVVLERPPWELDLPPRLVGPHEQTK